MRVYAVVLYQVYLLLQTTVSDEGQIGKHPLGKSNVGGVYQLL